MKKVIVTALLVFTICTSIPLVAQDFQIFSTSVEYPDQGTLGCAGAVIDAAGLVSVPVGSTARFFLTGKPGYEPAGFYVDGVFRDGGLIELPVVSAGAAVNIVGVFMPLRDLSGPSFRIITSSNSSIVKWGADDSIEIVVDVLADSIAEIAQYRFELFRNGTLLDIPPVCEDFTLRMRFKNVPLSSGDNIFMVRGSDAVAYSNYKVDFLRVHYSSDEVTDGTTAVILVDERLHSQPGIAGKIDNYCSSATLRQTAPFGVVIQSINGIDDWTSDQIRNHLIGLKQTFPLLEGVLFIGNIKLPSFYKPRGDILQSRLIAHKYEDLDIVLDNREGSSADYDYMSKGSNPLPELWCAFMPVGFDGVAEHNTYEAFAAQLSPYLDKLTSRHSGWTDHYSIYQLSNQLWDMGGLEFNWGMDAFRFYSLNDTGYGPFHWYEGLDPALFYSRMNSVNEYRFDRIFNRYRQYPWMGEGWQSKDIYLRHMQESPYSIVWSNAHSWEGGSIIDSGEAKAMTGGGQVQLLSGCGVGGFKQYGASSVNDAGVYADGNILCSYIYGNSEALAALGSPFNRGHESEFEKLSLFMTQYDYLGAAHYFRKCLQYHNAGDNPDELKMLTQEILIGDPFVRTGYTYDVDTQQPSVPGNLTTSSITSSSFTLAWDPSTDDYPYIYYLVSVTDPQGVTRLEYTDTTSMVIPNLVPSTSYSIMVRTYDSWGNLSAYSEPLVVMTAEGDVGPAPTNVTYTITGEASVRVEWDDPGVERIYPSYYVLFQSVDVEYDYYFQAYFAESDSLTVDYIDTGKTYTVSVKGIFANGESGLWSEQMVLTIPPAVPPTIPANLRATNVGETSIAIEWDPSTDSSGILGYDVIVMYPDGTNSYSNSYENRFVIDSLSPGAVYRIKVQAFDGLYIYGEWTEPIFVRTQTASPPTAPRNLAVTEITDSSISIVWEESTDNGFISRYECEIAGPDETFVIEYISQLNLKATGLAPETAYTIRVRACDDSNTLSAWSEPLTAMTHAAVAPTVPQDLAVIAVGENSVTLGWSPSTDDIGVYGYEVMCTGPDGFVRQFGMMSSGAFIDYLESDTTFTFAVRAYDSSYNYSEWSGTVTATTLVSTTPVPTATPMLTPGITSFPGTPMSTSIPVVTPDPTPAPTDAPVDSPSPTESPIETPAPTVAPPVVTDAPSPEPTDEATPEATRRPARTPKPHRTHAPRPTRDVDRADLAACEITRIGELVKGNQIILSSGIVNMGTRDSGAFKVKWRIGFRNVVTHEIENIGAGATLRDGRTAFTWTPKMAGVYVISFVVDAKNDVKELKFHNNVAVIKLRIAK